MISHNLADPLGKSSSPSLSLEDLSISQNPSKLFAEFFAGIGLMRLGLEKEGWTVAFSNDIDENKKRMYEGHFGAKGKRFLLGNIHDISSDSVPTVTLATASFPCNDLSLAGARNGLAGEQSSAFWGFVRVLEEMGKRKPPFVLIENVPGFLSSNNGEDFKNAMLALSNLGYAVDPFVLDAAFFVPQSRQRLFVIGVLNGQHLGKPQKEIFSDTELRPPILSDFILWSPEINWAVRSLPSPPKNRKKLEEILEQLPDSAPEWWSNVRAEYLLNQMSPRHRQTAERMIRGQDWSYGTVFRRVRKGRSMAELRVDGLAGCLRTPRGGSGRQILFKAGKGRYCVRLLTPRECASLMGAYEYKIEAPLNQALFGFGDAVCVPVIQWIARNYLNPVFEQLRQTSLDTYGKEERNVV